MPSAAHLIDDRYVTELLQAAGERPGRFSVSPCTGGGNNRVFVVEADGRRMIAKWYFTHPSDTRDRLKAEYAFLAYAHELGLTCVPRPLSCLSDEGIALYEFIEGRPFRPGGVAARHIGAAIRFFLDLNGRARLRMKDVLPDASEACFSVSSQAAMVRKRIERLSGIVPATPTDEEAMRFAERLRRAFDSTAGGIAKTAAGSGIDVDAVLPDEARCVSPSDFGFHNALLGPEGRTFFLDFEYAGWDDPAKMACDFFCQPAVPVDHAYFDDFLQQVMGFSDDRALLIARARIMLPLFRMKWCCILLNEFLPESAKRRRFAVPDADPDERKRAQLVKADRLLDGIFP